MRSHQTQPAHPPSSYHTSPEVRVLPATTCNNITHSNHLCINPPTCTPFLLHPLSLSSPHLLTPSFLHPSPSHSPPRTSSHFFTPSPSHPPSSHPSPITPVFLPSEPSNQFLSSLQFLGTLVHLILQPLLLLRLLRKLLLQSSKTILHLPGGQRSQACCSRYNLMYHTLQIHKLKE